MFKSRFSFFVTIIAITSLLASCRTAELETSKQFNKNSPTGLVVLSLTQDNPQYYTDVLIAYSRQNAETFESHRGFSTSFIDTTMLQNDPVVNDFKDKVGKVFVAELEPNTYNIEWIRYYSPGYPHKKESTLFFKEKKPFEIKKGQVTYLGEFNVKNGKPFTAPNLFMNNKRQRDIAVATKKHPNASF